LRVTETGADLALALAVASAQLHRPVAAGAVANGELGLGGEVRTVPQLERRLDEAARLGFAVAIVPANGPSTSGARAGIGVVPVRDVTDALERGLG
jgi:DNA repair protein RadA/Sms